MPRSAAGSSSDAVANVPPEPPKLRSTPQRRGNIGPGKLYADEAAFVADLQAHEQERKERKALMKERERALDKLRDRSKRQRDGDAGDGTARSRDGDPRWPAP